MISTFLGPGLGDSRQWITDKQEKQFQKQGLFFLFRGLNLPFCLEKNPIPTKKCKSPFLLLKKKTLSTWQVALQFPKVLGFLYLLCYVVFWTHHFFLNFEQRTSTTSLFDIFPGKTFNSGTFSDDILAFKEIDNWKRFGGDCYKDYKFRGNSSQQSLQERLADCWDWVSWRKRGNFRWLQNRLLNVFVCCNLLPCVLNNEQRGCFLISWTRLQF